MNDCDWMVGYTLEEVSADYLAKYAGGLPRDEALDHPHELSDAEMLRLTFIDEDGAKRSFRAQLAKLEAEGQKFPCIFATTEY